jgi:hypothetical protein
MNYKIFLHSTNWDTMLAFAYKDRGKPSIRDSQFIHSFIHQ